MSVMTGRAQTCNGSLGDPIINIDFGSGTNKFGSPVGSGITNYGYVAATPNDGSYTIANTTNGMHPTTWWQTTDHTGNTGGYMMIVNANEQTTDYFYRNTVTSLCPGTTYEFAAWVLNLATVNNNKPNITFKISKTDGTVLQSYNTGDIPYNSAKANWVKYGMLFTTPASSGDIELTMTNNGPGGNGNDIALDDITFRPCGPVLTSNFINTNTTSQNACSGTNQSFTMSAQASAGYATPAYQWQVSNSGTWTDIPGATNTTYTANFTPAVAGTYQYRITSAEQSNINSPTCRVTSNPITLTINATPSSTITGSNAICEGETLSLSASAADMYIWTGPNGFSAVGQQITINNATPANSGIYHVDMARNGCTNSGSVNVVVNPKVNATAGSNVTICQGDATRLQATGGTSYVWSPATGLSNPNVATPFANPSTTTNYTVTVTNSRGCSATASVKVTVLEPPVVNADKDKEIIQGQSVMLNGKINGSGYSYYWSPTTYLSNPASLTPVATPTDDITYTLYATTGTPCNYEVSDKVFIRVYKKVTVPNTFTPNGDGVNDNWDIEALITYPESLTQVFNRYGQMVYQSNGYSKPWDGRQNGKPVPEGTYYYRIDLKNGQVLSGWVAILR